LSVQAGVKYAGRSQYAEWQNEKISSAKEEKTMKGRLNL